MLTIRQQQVEAFWALRDRDLVPKVTRYLRGAEPERSAAVRGSLEAWVEEQLVRARGLGVLRAWDRGRFARYELVYGPEFETREPWASRVFARAEHDGTRLMDRVEFIHRNYLARGPARRGSERDRG